jgi:hypothetical protein
VNSPHFFCGVLSSTLAASFRTIVSWPHACAPVTRRHFKETTMNELTSDEPLQQILDRRERSAALSTATTVALALAAWALMVTLALSMVASAPPIDPIAIDVDSPPTNLDGLRYSP